MTAHESPLPPRPRIALIGAGVLGTVYAAKLARAGHDVTVVERAPTRASQIRDHGLVIEALDGSRRQVVRVPVRTALEALAAEDVEFDVAIVLARKTHLEGVLTMLAPTAIPTVLFMVSNAEGPDEIVAAMGERAVLGFPGAGGRVVNGVVQFSIPPALMQSTMIGEVDGSIGRRAKSLKALLDSAGFHARISRNMDAWLKSHEAFVATAGNATYIAGDGAAVAADGDLLTLNIRAIREVYRAMDVAALPVSPSWFRLWQRLPMPLLRAAYGRFIGSTAWDDLGTDQLRSMRDEVEVVTDELLMFTRAHRVPAPALSELASRRRNLPPVVEDGPSTPR